MCNRPITHDDKTFACRSCDECIATRRAGWEDRAMMELATSPHCSVWSLTYDEETERNRDAARMFVYQDVSDWLKRVRAALAYKYAGQRPWVRFIVAGEQGDKCGRCHWHVILYSSHEVQTVGTFHGFKTGVRGKTELRWPEDGVDMLTVERPKAKRLDWDLWGHGFVTLQGPGFEVMHYVLSYCLADQFTVEKAKDTARVLSASNFATGLFRMSKRPSIGEKFVFQRFAQFAERGECLPSLSLKVPGVKGYYHPAGRMRELMLWGLVGLNQTARNITGRDAPQWSTLLHSCKDNENDLEVLIGPLPEKLTDEQLAKILYGRQRDSADQRRIDLRKKCGSALPCHGCLVQFDEDKLKSLGVVKFETESGFGEKRWVTRFHALPGYPSVKERWRQRIDGINPHCLARDSVDVCDAFERPDDEGRQVRVLKRQAP